MIDAEVFGELSRQIEDLPLVAEEYLS